MLAIMLAGPLFILGASSCMAQLNPDEPVSAQDQQTPAQPQGGIVGEVRSAAGDPIAGAVIEVKSLDQPSPPIPERIVLSQADGKFFWPLKPGSYEVSATADGYRAVTAVVCVDAERSANLDFVLEKLR